MGRSLTVSRETMAAAGFGGARHRGPPARRHPANALRTLNVDTLGVAPISRSVASARSAPPAASASRFPSATPGGNQSGYCRGLSLGWSATAVHELGLDRGRPLVGDHVWPLERR